MIKCFSHFVILIFVEFAVSCSGSAPMSHAVSLCKAYSFMYIYIYIFVCVCVCVCVYCCFTLGARLLARSQYSEGPAIGHLGTGFFLVSLCLQANAEMVPKFPSCYHMPVMYPSRLKFPSYFFFIFVYM